MPATELLPNFQTFCNGMTTSPVKFTRATEKSASASSAASTASGSSLPRDQPAVSQHSQPSQGPASSLPVQLASPEVASSLPRGQPASSGASQQSPSTASLPRGQPAVSQSTSLKWNYTHTFGSCKYVSMYF